MQLHLEHDDIANSCRSRACDIIHTRFRIWSFVIWRSDRPLPWDLL